MASDLLILLAMTLFFPALLVIIGSFLFIPRFVQALHKWRQTHGPKDFSAMVFYGFISFLVFSPAYMFILQIALRLYSLSELPIYIEVLVVFILALLTFRLFLPRTAMSYNEYKSTRKNIHLSNTALFGFASSCALMLIYQVLFHAHLGGVINAP